MQLQAHEAPLSDVSDGGDCEGAAVRFCGRNSAVTVTGAVQMEYTELIEPSYGYLRYP